MNEKSQGFPHTNSLIQHAKGFHNITHHDLLTAKDLVYNPCRFKCSQPIMEAESAEYGAYTFELNDLSVRFRVAKITPTKIGQFVTL
jgi:hypothetical protein